MKREAPYSVMIIVYLLFVKPHSMIADRMNIEKIRNDQRIKTPEIAKLFPRLIKLSLLCVLAAAGNYFLNVFCVYFMEFPLFLDTVFNAAVTFAAGLIPGLITALLTNIAVGVKDGGVNPFILCSIIEVIVIYRLKPDEPSKIFTGKFFDRGAFSETKTNSLISVLAKLMVLYIVCCLVISVLGGLIDFTYHSIFSNPKPYFSAEDAFKLGLLRSGIPVFAMDILSRIPVNIVDRFIVIFGGYFISRLFSRLLPLLPKSENSPHQLGQKIRCNRVKSTI